MSCASFRPCRPAARSTHHGGLGLSCCRGRGLPFLPRFHFAWRQYLHRPHHAAGRTKADGTIHHRGPRQSVLILRRAAGGSAYPCLRQRRLLPQDGRRIARHGDVRHRTRACARRRQSGDRGARTFAYRAASSNRPMEDIRASRAAVVRRGLGSGRVRRPALSQAGGRGRSMHRRTGGRPAGVARRLGRACRARRSLSEGGVPGAALDEHTWRTSRHRPTCRRNSRRDRTSQPRPDSAKIEGTAIHRDNMC